MRKYKVLDAFCGAGGLSTGLKNAGFDIIFSFDSDSKAIETMKQNFKDHVSIQSDIKDICDSPDFHKLGLKKGELDLLAGGPPCQGFSVQRTVGNDHDQRNLLIDDYGDLIAMLLPKFFLLENVPSIGGKRGRVILQKFKDNMEKIGYFCHEKILDAQDFNVPQRRKRYILIGEFHADKTHTPLFVWPKENLTKKITVRETISHLPEIPLTANDAIKYPLHIADKLSEINKLRISFLKEGQSRKDLPEELLAECHKISADIIGHRNVYGRMSWDDVAPTITAKFDSFTRGKFGHPSQNRSISLLEGALLQTFPESYRFIGNKVDIARQIGNAVPPVMSYYLGLSIIKALDNKYGI
jgi:DNA (cytosine-5)-methyltransferase 1